MKTEIVEGRAGKVPVNTIIPFSVVDGPGNRTTVFLQKCNIACSYCHNPETQRLCTGCGICVKQCPVEALNLQQKEVLWDESKCVHCDSCIRACPNFASPKVKYMDASEVYREVRRNIPFIRGITVSGGECTLYPKFLKELFTYVKAEGLSCYIDSNGCVDLSRYQDMMKVCDKVMLDIKAWDDKKFRSLTGRGNETVKKNLLFLARRHQLEEVRIVCLEPEVDVEEVICGIAETVGAYLDEFTLKLIAFRNHGVCTKLKTREMTSMEQMKQWKETAEKNGFSNIRIV